MSRRIALVATFAGQAADFREIARRAAPLNVAVMPKRGAATLGPDDIAISATRLKCKAGEVYCGRNLGKVVEVERLKAAGVPTLKTGKITKDLQLDPAEWGQQVIVKPVFGMQGKGLSLVPIERVKQFIRRDYVAQQFAYTGPQATKIRMLTFFGRVLYSVRVTNTAQGSLITSSPERTWTAELTPEWESLARQCYAAIPEVPVHAVDIVTDVNTGLSYVLEVNARGHTWLLSMGHGRRLQRQIGFDLYAQLDALGQAAQALKEKFG